MAASPTEWLSSTMETCCNKFFSGYRFDSCMGKSSTSTSYNYPPDADDCNVMLFYPDWSGANVDCLDDGKLGLSTHYPVTKISASTYHFAHVLPVIPILYRKRALLHAK